MTEQQAQPEQHYPPTVHYSHPEYNAQHWPPSAGGPGIPPADRNKGRGKAFFKKHGMLLGLMGVTFVVAGGLGFGTGQATFDPQVITKTEVKTETKTVTKEVTPQSCITALNDADKIISYSAEFAGVMVELVDGVKAMSVSKIQAANEKMDPITKKVQDVRPEYQSARELCRGY